MHITVYLGASCGTDPHLAQAVRELGAWIGAAGHTLVYGGSKTGLMGLLAQSALEQGGSVIGVEPECFMAQDLQYDGLTQLIVTRSMAERKAKMIHLGDAFIAFPGGTGTLEEITEVMSQVSLGQLSAPCILYDLDGLLLPPEGPSGPYDRLRSLLPGAPAGHPLRPKSPRNSGTAVLISHRAKSPPLFQSLRLWNKKEPAGWQALFDDQLTR